MPVSPNQSAARVLEGAIAETGIRVTKRLIGGAVVADFGVESAGSLQAGKLLAEACMGGLGLLDFVPCDENRFGVSNGVFVRTDNPLLGCLGSQYAGWPVQAEDYFAMGSGPMRMLRGKEPVLEKLGLVNDDRSVACGVLESEKFPTDAAIELIAKECGLKSESLVLAIAPSTSIAGCVQIVARSIETAMHKLDELDFDVKRVVSGTGFAPLPPPAKSGDVIAGIGRTNDAMLYGAHVSLWVDCEDAAIESVLEKVPSSSSKDHGKPFATIFAEYDHDFYQVDPSLFSPARVTIHNLQSGRTFQSGQFESEILRESFGT